MRIIYVSADRGIPVFGEKGASIHIQEMLHAFKRLDHDVRCVTARRGDGEAGGLQVEEISATMSGATRAEKERAAMVQADAIEARLIEIHRSWPFDLIYERYSLWSAAGCRAARTLKVPIVSEVNAPLIQEQARYRTLICENEARGIEAEVFNHSSALAAVSQQVSHYISQNCTDPARIHVIGNGVNTAHFNQSVTAANIPSIPDDAFVVGFTGSLKMWHGVDTLLNAFRRFRDENSRAHLLICGDGPKRGWIEGFINGANLHNAVTLTGWVHHSDLPRLIARMDIATAPYPVSEAHYFSPLKLYEYLAMGRPVVASDIGQTAELLSGSNAALLLPPGDAEALARAMAELAADPARLEFMAQTAAFEGAKHDWADNASRVVNIAQEESVIA